VKALKDSSHLSSILSKSRSPISSFLPHSSHPLTLPTDQPTLPSPLPSPPARKIQTFRFR